MSLKFKWVEAKPIPEGRHTGTIVRLEERNVRKDNKEFTYIDICFELDDCEGAEVRYGCPKPENMKLSKNSMLGKFVLLFKPDIKPDDDIDLEEILIGQRVSFMTVNQESSRGGTFAQIVDNSIKPLGEKKDLKAIKTETPEVTEPPVQTKVVE